MQMQLHSHLFARIGPPPGISPAQRMAWNHTVAKKITTMSPAELRRLLAVAFPERDTYRVRPQDVLVSASRNPALDRPLGRWLPPFGKVAPSARAANVPESVVKLSAALVYLTGAWDQLQSGQQMVIAASSRRLGDVLDCSHVWVLSVVRRLGERTQTLIRTRRTSPADGAGKRGICPSTGRRAGAPAHPSNEYQLLITNEILDGARALADQLGTPTELIPYQIVEEPQPSARELVEASRLWKRIIDGLVADSWPREMIHRIAKNLTPTAYDGITLTIRGAIHPCDLELLSEHAPCRLRLLLPAAEPERRTRPAN